MVPAWLILSLCGADNVSLPLAGPDPGNARSATTYNWFPGWPTLRIPLKPGDSIAHADVDLLCPRWQGTFRKEINVAADVPGKAQMIAIWLLRAVLGLTFLTVGAAKVSGTAHSVEYFAAIGWGQWFRYLTGVLDISGATLLFVPRWTCYGAGVLAFSVGLATLISLTLLHGNTLWGGSEMTAVPLLFTLLAATLAWLTRPHRVR